MIYSLQFDSSMGLFVNQHQAFITNHDEMI